MLNDCALEDLGFEGTCYTWEKGRFASNNIKERLDSGVTTDSWSQLFPCYHVFHHSYTFSDHYPVVVDTGNGFRGGRRQHLRLRLHH